MTDVRGTTACVSVCRLVQVTQRTITLNHFSLFDITRFSGARGGGGGGGARAWRQISEFHAAWDVARPARRRRAAAAPGEHSVSIAHV